MLQYISYQTYLISNITSVLGISFFIPLLWAVSWGTPQWEGNVHATRMEVKKCWCTKAKMCESIKCKSEKLILTAASRCRCPTANRWSGWCSSAPVRHQTRELKADNLKKKRKHQPGQTWAFNFVHRVPKLIQAAESRCTKTAKQKFYERRVGIRGTHFPETWG